MISCYNLSIVAIILIFVLISLTKCVCECNILKSDTVHRNRRQLLFPNSTLLQLNAGVGTPTPIKTINVNWAFQANFQLPWNRSQIPVDIFYANTGYDGDSRSERDVRVAQEDKNEYYESDAKLYHFYKYVEEVLYAMGHNGTMCVLRTLCQLGAEPLHSEDHEDLLHEIASFVLNPNHDETEHLTEDNEAYPYIQAYKHGQEHGDCVKKFENCSMSLVDIFSKLYD